MKMTKAAKPMATLRARARRPAVIIETQSRQASRDSCRANQTALPAWIIGRQQRALIRPTILQLSSRNGTSG